MSKEWIIPVPKGTAFNGREVVGLIPCHGHSCSEYVLVRLDRKGAPYAACDNALAVRGCKRRYDLIRDDIPLQTEEYLFSKADEFNDLPPEHQAFLAKSWNMSVGELIHGRTEKTEQEAAPVLGKTAGSFGAIEDEPAEPLGKTGGIEPEPASGPEEIEPADSSASGFGDPELDEIYGL